MFRDLSMCYLYSREKDCTGDLLTTLHSRKARSNHGLRLLSPWNTAGWANPVI